MPRFLHKSFAPVDIAWLAFFRILFGCVMLVEVIRYFAYGWIEIFNASDFHFGFYAFEWVKPWPDPGMHLHFAALGVSALCLALGFCYRFMAAFFFIGFTYVFLLDETRYLNHFYLISLVSFLMIFLPAHRAWSVDAWLRPAIRSSVTPAWTLWLMRAQIGIPYFFGGIAKLDSDWLHGEPMRMWLAERSHMPLIGAYVHTEWLVYSFVIGGLLLDLLIVPGLLWHRTRLLAFCAAASFHLLNSQLFHIGIFPWLMLGATFIFFPPDAARRCLLRLGIHPRSATGRAVHSTVPRWRPRQRVLGALALYLAVQVLVPLRHFAYPGNVHWTEEGHRFSWHMKLRTKSGDALFDLVSPSTGRTWLVDPLDHLSEAAYAKMTTHPDMILQYAHYLAAQKRREGFPDIEVRARAMVSLNGRPPRPLIDPRFDLAHEPRSLAHAAWVLPLTEPLSRPSVRLEENDRHFISGTE
ncbi:HTTM domain-containing protein [Prosthecobacter sp.]|uniref:HTTM domain-containing protein n=1 Tax=Prosthecobacter sp. TaxID=1965333 RepID=UPI002488BF5A|nr:HTTM domain-containing protein [Prosthecobacter sp.]MDI1312890.1 HTTM domain-containing protein [Prosthecobacter sp.]